MFDLSSLLGDTVDWWVDAFYRWRGEHMEGINATAAESLGLFPLPKAQGWPLGKGIEGYQDFLVPMSKRARALYEPIYKADPLHFLRMAEDIARHYGIPAGWLASIVHHESGGKPWVYNWGEHRESTAIGLGQTTYTSCRAQNTWHSFDAVANLHAAAKILTAHYRKRGRDWNRALAGYAGKPEPYQGTLIARADDYASLRSA